MSDARDRNAPERAFSSSGEDTARAYVGPGQVPAAPAGAPYESESVRVAPPFGPADPRRVPTLPRVASPLDQPPSAFNAASPPESSSVRTLGGRTAKLDVVPARSGSFVFGDGGGDLPPDSAAPSRRDPAFAGPEPVPVPQAEPANGRTVALGIVLGLLAVIAVFFLFRAPHRQAAEATVTAAPTSEPPPAAPPVLAPSPTQATTPEAPRLVAPAPSTSPKSTATATPPLTATPTVAQPVPEIAAPPVVAPPVIRPPAPVELPKPPPPPVATAKPKADSDLIYQKQN